MKINHISISRESTWSECNQKYKYKYHLDIVPKEEPIYFLYGKMVHKIIETYTLSRGKVCIQEITSAILNGDILLEEKQEKKPIKIPYNYKSVLPKHLNNFMKLTKLIGVDGEVEKKFFFDLDPPFGRNLVGVIDRIINKNDNIFIIDYKTTKKGKWRKDRSTIKKDLQLQSYARVIQKELNISADKIKTALYYLEDGELIDTSFPQEVLDSVEPRLLSVYKNIEKMDPDHVIGNTGEHCFRCDYGDICPFFSTYG